MAKGIKTASQGGGGNILYYEIASFMNGLDTRKDVLTAPAGTLRTLQNCHITQGGEIEKRSRFEQKWTISPTGFCGLAAINNYPVLVYNQGGSGLVPPGAGGTGQEYGRITHTAPSGVTLAEMTDWDIYNGKLFISFLGTAGGATGVYSYYDGIYVPEADGRAYSVRTYKEKVYGLNGRYLFFSALGDPTKWVDPPPGTDGTVDHNGSGFISLGATDSDSENMIALEVYYDKMALFSSLGAQLWFLDPNPALNQYYQTLRDAGTLARASVRQYVANDVYFLGSHGIRSLRARDLTTTAAVADVGSPIDEIIQNLIATRGWSGAANDMGGTQAVLSPRTGRMWIACYDTIFVLSNFASPNIAAWSTYLPGFNIAKNGMAFADPYIYLADTSSNIWRFGGYGALVYDSCPVQVLTPGLSFEKPTAFKFYQGFDAVCRAQAGSPWNISMSFDPAQDSPPFDQICTMEGPTPMGGRIPVSGRGTHLQIKATHQAPGPATLSKMVVHYAASDSS
jgi:hypothetical protein